MINKYVIYCIYKYISIVMTGRSFSLGYFISSLPNPESVSSPDTHSDKRRERVRNLSQGRTPRWVSLLRKCRKNLSVPGRKPERNHSQCRRLSAATALEREEGGEELKREMRRGEMERQAEQREQ